MAATKAIMKQGGAESKAVAVQLRAIEEMASRYGMDAAALVTALKATVLPKVKDPETKAWRDPSWGEVLGFVVTANAYRFNPFTKEIYAFPNQQGGMSPVVSIDGRLRVINEHPQHDGLTVRIDEWFENEKGRRLPVSATCTIWRKDRSKPIEITEYYDECYRDTAPWNTMPGRQLRHKAIKECSRVAYGLNIPDEDEARDMAPRDVEIESQFRIQAPFAQPATLGDLTARMEAQRKAREPGDDDDIGEPPADPENELGEDSKT